MLQVAFSFSSVDPLGKKAVLWIFFSVFLVHFLKIFYLFLVQSIWESVRVSKRYTQVWDVSKSKDGETKGNSDTINSIAKSSS